MTRPETHLLLFLRDKIENWEYVDNILFLIILLVSVGFTNPCDSCMVTTPYGTGELVSCQDAFNMRINATNIDIGTLNLTDNLVIFDNSYTNLTTNLTFNTTQQS